MQQHYPLVHHGVDGKASKAVVICETTQFVVTSFREQEVRVVLQGYNHQKTKEHLLEFPRCWPL